MHKILLILEDYSELMFIQIVLKKLGFDVDGIQNPHAISDRLMMFRPSVVIAPEEGKRINKDIVDQALLPMRGVKIVFLNANARGVEILGESVCRIRSPIQPVELIQALGNVCHTDTHQLTEKYKKLKRQLSAEAGNERILKDLEEGATESEAISAKGLDPDRTERYEKFLAKSKDKVDQKFDSKAVANQHQTLRAVKTITSAEEDDINKQRQTFTQKLFKRDSK